MKVLSPEQYRILMLICAAHNCIRDGPANVIMSDFYHPARNNGKKVPHILGLTASPVINSKPQGLQCVVSPRSLRNHVADSPLERLRQTSMR